MSQRDQIGENMLLVIKEYPQFIIWDQNMVAYKTSSKDETTTMVTN